MKLVFWYRATKERPQTRVATVYNPDTLKPQGHSLVRGRWMEEVGIRTLRLLE